jgi:acetyltransferase-like isoleucine patch superfamily enzyme
MIGALKKIYAALVGMRNSIRIAMLNARDGIRVGEKSQVYRGAIVKIWKGGSIEIGSGAEIMFGVVILTYGGRITIGKNCSINPYSVIYGHGGVTIGDNVLIAGGTMIIPNNHIYKDVQTPIALQGNDSKGIVIEDDVWIGHGCTILDGVRIGRGSVVAAGAVVNENVEPYSVVGGVPARLIKRRTV